MRINWDTRLSLDQSYRLSKLEYRPLSTLRPHEKPSSWRVWEITKAMREGALIPLPSIAEDGMILDGHGRFYATRRILGKNGIIPVEVSYY